VAARSFSLYNVGSRGSWHESTGSCRLSSVMTGDAFLPDSDVRRGRQGLSVGAGAGAEGREVPAGGLAPAVLGPWPVGA